ncbi:prephenate dehydrogenase [Streptomyces sp. 135]|uniref:prephenate dehydrogenase n=1 Tax=Streptomyces sp. 135 TaxID=2838850 RepID=UPI0021D8EC64|nr:prephenate dehydrogenase [Streptomyces sp. 135]
MQLSAAERPDLSGCSHPLSSPGIPSRPAGRVRAVDEQMRHTMLRTAVVVGAGLIGTSIALSLSAKGVTVYLSDKEPMAALTAAALGAGRAEEPPGPVDLAVLAVPPADIAATLADAQSRGLARAYTDVASVKAQALDAIEAAGCDTRTYLGGHPMAGGERSGPLAARADLFEGRVWALVPTPTTSAETWRTVRSLLDMCGATPLVMDPHGHDRAVALVSHTPHLVASLMAARLQHATDAEVGLSGQGVRDVTRVAGGDPKLWLEILSANAGTVADILAELAGDLDDAIGALRALTAPDGDPVRTTGATTLTGLLSRGCAGHGRLPQKRGAPQGTYATVSVLIGDQPGELARLFTDVGAAGVNIEDIFIDHAPGQITGLVELLVTTDAADRLRNSLRVPSTVMAH